MVAVRASLFSEMARIISAGLVNSIESVKRWRSIARPEQLAPPGDWRVWLILTGRGWGKTRTIVEWAHEQALAIPGSRGAIVGATAADVRDVLIEGESGLLTCAAPDFRPIYESSKRRVTWPNGTTAITFSADEPERFRGPQYHWIICDELAAWRYPETFDMLMLGLRLGSDPRAAIATTPKPTRLIKTLLKDEHTAVTRGSTYANRANLAPAFLETIIRKYEGTRLARQEINAEILDDIEGALWLRSQIDALRVSVRPQLTRLVVAVDPAATSSEDANETGIVVAGLGIDKHGYVLDDMTIKGSPAAWAKQAIAAYSKYSADRIIYETNQGGEMVLHTLRSVTGEPIAMRGVHASRGKVARAEPVAALYEQGRVHHVGSLAALEDQLCSWTPGDDSPDRLDALVWALTDLMVGAQPLTAEVRRYA